MIKRKLPLALVCLAALGFLRWMQNRRGAEGMVGSFLGIPYDFRWPSSAVLRERFWNREDQRVLTPHVLGWGWSVNFYALGKHLGLLA